MFLSMMMSYILNVHGVHTCLWKSVGSLGWGDGGEEVPSFPLPRSTTTVHYLGSLKLKPQLSPALSHHYISSGQHELQTHFLALWPSGSWRLWLGRVMTRNWKEIQGDVCDGGRPRTKCKGVKKQMALFIWKCSVLHPLCRLVTHRLTTSCILWVFLTLGHCLTLKWYMELQWQKLKWGILESFMQNASSYYDNILPPNHMHAQYTVCTLPWDETRILSECYKATCTMKRKAVLSVA